MGRTIFFQLFIFLGLMGLMLINSSYGQDKEIEYDTLNIDGDSTEEVYEQEVFEAPEGEDSGELRKKQNKEVSKELEETMKKINEDEIVEIKEEEIKPEKIEVEEVEVKAPTSDPRPIFGFLFDNKKKALFETRARWRNFGFAIGMNQYFPGAYQTSSSGNDKNSDWETGLKFSLEFGEVNNWSFIPFITYDFSTESDDGYFTQYRYGFGGEAAYRIKDWFRLKTGTTALFTTIKGNETRLVDIAGDGSQGTFFTNEGPRTSIVNTLDFGAEFLFNKVSIALSSKIVSAFESEKRDYIHGLYLTYLFDFGKDEVVSGESGEVFED